MGGKLMTVDCRLICALRTESYNLHAFVRAVTDKDVFEIAAQGAGGLLGVVFALEDAEHTRPAAAHAGAFRTVAAQNALDDDPFGHVDELLEHVVDPAKDAVEVDADLKRNITAQNLKRIEVDPENPSGSARKNQDRAETIMRVPLANRRKSCIIQSGDKNGRKCRETGD